MFEDVFEGIMSVLFSIGIFAVGILTYRRKIGNYDLYDGTVTSVNPETRDCFCIETYFVSMTCLKVKVSVTELKIPLCLISTKRHFNCNMEFLTLNLKVLLCWA